MKTIIGALLFLILILVGQTVDNYFEERGWIEWVR